MVSLWCPHLLVLRGPQLNPGFVGVVDEALDHEQLCFDVVWRMMSRGLLEAEMPSTLPMTGFVMTIFPLPCLMIENRRL